MSDILIVYREIQPVSLNSVKEIELCVSNEAPDDFRKKSMFFARKTPIKELFVQTTHIFTNM